jgi:VanZ family protein
MISFISYMHTCPIWTRMALAFGYLVLISFLSLSTSSSLFQLSPDIPGFDKLVHFLMYGGLGALLRWVFWNHAFKNIKSVWILGGVFVYGFLMEILQALVTDGERFFAWGDTWANIAGAVVFWVLAGYVLRRLEE